MLPKYIKTEKPWSGNQGFSIGGREEEGR